MNHNVVVDLNMLSADIAELMLKNKFLHEELWEYDDSNDIFIYKEDKQELLEKTIEGLKLFINENHIVKYK